ncbi:hypothetical protein CISIN_1g029438mg [Citrus sinensis]|uniref:Uncharacterized protein n=1 Tax=Citrus sinensis TaxID=2711 RepID=A0A067DRM6_CITSI|nr:hypothetical protein CISIN_1g029438mg [Citrus sinensis]KDO45507.1 hypothetical protein CISIN_1g029438mg [Citrus sinensis]KDO45508.1 hypothetical protein CISIN_1g029438mg [Citrus sinensis]
MSGSPPLLLNQILFFLCGCAYSLPLPFLRWKSHTFMAPLCLVITMGLTGLPFYMHTQQYVLGRPFVITRPLILMGAIMSIFAFVNGLLKDLPDVEGDKKFGMNTLCVLLGKEKVGVSTLRQYDVSGLRMCSYSWGFLVFHDKQACHHNWPQHTCFDFVDSI